MEDSTKYLKQADFQASSKTILLKILNDLRGLAHSTKQLEEVAANARQYLGMLDAEVDEADIEDDKPEKPEKSEKSEKPEK